MHGFMHHHGPTESDPHDQVACETDTFAPELLYNSYYGQWYVHSYARFGGCSPHNPQVCRVQAFLWQYLEGPGTWEEVSSGPVSYSCDYNGSNADYFCTPTSSVGDYKTEGDFTITEDNVPSVSIRYSGVASIACY